MVLESILPIMYIYIVSDDSLHISWTVQLDDFLDTNSHNTTDVFVQPAQIAYFALGSQKQRRSDNPTLTELCPRGTIFHRK